MKKNYRVKANQDFSQIIRKGKAFKTDSFTVHCLKNNLTFTRIGVSVSTKLGNAIVRNRIKRQIRSMCDSMIQYQQQSFDIIVIARNNYLYNNYHDNLLILQNILHEIGIN